jgi:hypothetical protein
VPAAPCDPIRAVVARALRGVPEEVRGWLSGKATEPG